MVASSSYVPQCGDAIWVTLDPQVGHEQAGRGPAIVISADWQQRKAAFVCQLPQPVLDEVIANTESLLGG
jgi:mRNA interferase MazF